MDEEDSPAIPERWVPDEYFREKSSARVWDYWLGGKTTTRSTGWLATHSLLCIRTSSP